MSEKQIPWYPVEEHNMQISLYCPKCDAQVFLRSRMICQQSVDVFKDSCDSFVKKHVQGDCH